MRILQSTIALLMMSLLVSCGGDEAAPGGTHGEGSGPDGHDLDCSNKSCPQDYTCFDSKTCVKNEDADAGSENSDDPQEIDPWWTGDKVERSDVPCAGDFSCQNTDPCKDGLCDHDSGTCLFQPLDYDRDGESAIECGGLDCNDKDPDIPALEEKYGNEVDDNCNGSVDESWGCNGADPLFDGTWNITYSDVTPVDYDYDMMQHRYDRDMWRENERVIRQEGCSFYVKTSGASALHGFRGGNGRVDPQPNGFFHRSHVGDRDDPDHQLLFSGTLSADKNTITGTCEGDYLDSSTEPRSFFRVFCKFTMTR